MTVLAVAQIHKALKNYDIGEKILANILRIFDENIEDLKKLDEHNYRLTFSGKEKNLSDTQLIYMLSSGTTKGLLLYTLMVASLKEGFDLLVDEVENHFHKTLVENMISLYETIGTEIFGNSRIVEILGCSEVTATSYLKRMKDELMIIAPVNGMGKGKYKFLL